MERKATSLQVSVKSSDKEDEQPVAHDQAKLTEAQENQRPKQKRDWLKRISSSKWTATFIAVTTLLGYVLLNFAVSVIAPFYSIWALQKGANLIVSGFVVGMAGLTVTIFSPILGVLLPHLGVKFSQLSGLFLAGGTFILFGFVTAMPSGAVFIAFSFILRAVEGIGTAMYSTASYTLLAQLFSEHKGMVVALSEVSIAVGYSFGPPIGGLLQSVGGFKLPFVSVGSIIMVLVVVLFLQQLTVAKTDKPRVLSPTILCRLFKFPIITLLVVNMVLGSVTLGAVASTLGRFLHAELGTGLGVIGALYLCISVPNVCSSIIVGKLTDILSPRCIEITGLLVAAVSYFFVGPPKFFGEPSILQLARKLWIYIVMLPVVGVSFSLVAVPVFSDIYRTASRGNGYGYDEVLASAVAGILVSAIAAGEFLGPALGGILVYYVGYQWMTTIFSGVLFFLGLVLIVATVMERLRCRAVVHSLNPDETQVVAVQTEL